MESQEHAITIEMLRKMNIGDRIVTGNGWTDKYIRIPGGWILRIHCTKKETITRVIQDTEDIK